ncbi:uncharacterized protein FOMMEDRAFT_141811 [Fomitiporia mediterranea MF3/22]|uniref:uncharacterized protein n=1 Tax=Fomitiporia mediterranea (strain MF3/22) TaxID=694068 RepID=UPI00044089A7|nr:uncharacterized protein FOMMEDRAFT_141811 [Fomitiporia mediterranea MF3/22]EJD01095.1 hypothetical protein FOMMEDRAFT_141811 [Fomitiporia mediterranea MF3/22]
MKAIDEPIISGYYRYTDILFEYHKTFEDPAEISAFKAFVSYNALGDPNHPLCIDKDKGIELYIGTLPSGQLRLMFSSAQMEYARYWLHAMGFTKKLFPLPGSDWLLTKNVLRNISTAHYKSGDEVKYATRMIDKNNKKLKGTDSALTSFRQNFEKVRDLYASRKGTWLAIDIEAWEMDHSVVTECGWSYLRWDGETEITDRGHYVVKENAIYTNGKYVPNARENYNFGDSKTLRKAELKKAVYDMMINFLNSGPLFLVFHDGSQDVKYLKGTYFDLPPGDLVFFLPSDTPKKGTFVVDTTELFGALEGEVGEKRSLEMMLRLLKIDAEHLHNAGNDAHYTLLALRSMAIGNQIDVQREDRWPNQTEGTAETGTSFKVNHKPWDLDSDYSDLEGAFGRPANAEAVEKHLAGLSDDENDDYW